jgi:hypothetical protein
VKPCYFGDSYDIVKRTFLEWLQPLGHWAVHPMFTEEPRLGFASDFSAFIGAPLVSPDVLRPTTDRQTYFSSCASHQHLLLDPNTGLKLNRGRPERSPDHLFDSDLLPIVNARPEGLTIIFDQSLSRGRTSKEQLEEKLIHFRAQGISGFAYTSHACFLFLTRAPATAERAHRLLFRQGRLPIERSLPDGLKP